MSFNREKYEYFFPSKVYQRVCVADVVQKCLEEEKFSLVDIVEEINEHSFFRTDKNKVFSIKCEEENKDALFICENHLVVVLFAKKKFWCSEKPSLTNTTLTCSDGKTETFCTGCIKHYLKIMYVYFYFHDFDLKCS